MNTKKQPSENRRSFLRKAGAIGLTVPFASLFPKWIQAQAKQDEPLPKRMLGRTGLAITCVGIGTGGVTQAAVLRRAKDVGFNYLDTAYTYGNGEAERQIGGIPGSDRNHWIISTKLDHHINHEQASVQDYKDSLETSLRRMQTDYVDIVFLHNAQTDKDLLNPVLHEAFELLRAEGKARFLGVSSHHPQMVPILQLGIRSGYYDVIMARFNFLTYPNQLALFQEAAQHQVGVIAMKVLAGAESTNLQTEEGTSFEQSAVRWALQYPEISSALVSIKTFSQLTKFSQIYPSRFNAQDNDVLHNYAQQNTHRVCRMCGSCLKHCPHEVPITDILRYRMYTVNYQHTERGKYLYNQLAISKKSNQCLDCSGLCEPHCPHGLPIQSLLINAHAWMESH